MEVTKWAARGYLLLRKIIKRIKMILIRPAFRKYGRNFRFDPDGLYTFDTIEVGDDVSIGDSAVFIAKLSGIRIGNKVMFAPNVSIRGGNHNTSVVGKFMYDVQEKRPDDDQMVIIDDDVWVGSNVTILNGVRLGRGCIVGAGAVVTKTVPPYAVAVGVPAKVLRYRFDVQTILRHEELLYPPEKRLSKIELEKMMTGV